MVANLSSPRAQRTRARLTAVALELFARQGFDQTTVAQIAAAAGVTQMTFFRHFGSKEAIVVEDPYDPLIVAAIAAQPRDLAALDRAIGGIRAAWRDETVELPRERLRIAARTPSLRPAMLSNTQRTQELIAAQLHDDGARPETAAVVAAAVLAALMTALLIWAESETDDSAGTVIEAALRDLEGHRHG